MRRITKYSKKIKLTYIKSAGVICAGMILAFPWFGSLSHTEEGYYTVVLNGEKLGAVQDDQIAENAYLEARRMIENQSDASIYIDYDLKIYGEDKLYGEKVSEEVLVDKMYNLLKESSVEVKEKAYVVDIDGFTVTLSSKEEVVELLNCAKSKYDTDNSFATMLTDSMNSRLSYISYDVVKLDREDTNNPVVFATANGTNAQVTQDVKPENKIIGIEFAEDVEIIETYVSTAQIISLDEAINLVTKDKEENKIYEVVEGDTLYGISDKFSLSLDGLLAMNPDYDEETNIQIGDRIVVTVPKPELSVVVKKQEVYKENYDVAVEYVYNDSQYTTYSSVLNEGSQGYREVVAEVKYVNGTEESREILDQTVITNAVAKVIEVGTLTPPTFIKPISGGMFSSGYGARWGTLHAGVDWACSVGTTIMASCGGTVVQAGWNGGYGYAVVIQHSNGTMTRYAHMSKILVNVGQYVTQGEKIGLSGNTGNSTGPHVHFEVIINGSRVNPLDYLN